MTFYIQTEQSNTGCGAPFQTLLFTIPPGGGAFTPDPNANQATNYIYADPVVAHPDGPFNDTLNTPLQISVLANDTDSKHNPLSVSAVTQGTYGSVVINSGNQTVTYTPTKSNGVWPYGHVHVHRDGRNVLLNDNRFGEYQSMTAGTC